MSKLQAVIAEMKTAGLTEEAQAAEQVVGASPEDKARRYKLVLQDMRNATAKLTKLLENDLGNDEIVEYDRLVKLLDDLSTDYGDAVFENRFQ